MPAPSLPARARTSILAPALAFGAIQSAAGGALGLPSQFDARGLAVALLLAVSGLLLSGLRSPTVPERREMRSVSERLRAVAFLFAPALAFPGFLMALFSIVAFLFWWLAPAQPLASREGVSPGATTRAELLHDLGLVPPPTRSDAVRPKRGAFFSFRRARESGLEERVGVLALAFSLLCVPFVAAVQDASRIASWLVFFLVSVASWERVFRAFAPGSQSPPIEGVPTHPRGHGPGARPNDTQKESIA